MVKRYSSSLILVTGGAVCVVALMYLVEQVLQPGYAIKSLAKVILFLGMIFLYAYVEKLPIKDVINLKRPVRWKGTFFLGLTGALFILGLFFVLKGQMDLTGIKQSLMTKEGLTKGNCLFVLGYIICVNSFLEESFFRGFLYHALKKDLKPISAAAISALLFAVYHIGIVSSWFNPFIFILCILGLAAAGLLLQFIEARNDSLCSSWMIHAFANGAINSIGALIIFLV